jgi:hypothetical protein
LSAAVRPYQNVWVHSLTAMTYHLLFFLFKIIIYIALSIASINTMTLMQPLGLWSAAHASLNPLSFPRALKFSAISCSLLPVSCIAARVVFLSLVCNSVVDVLYAASSCIAITIVVV